MDLIRILFLSDTHLGFDAPRRPRVARRRRGPDFFRNFELALEPARRGEVDLVLHGGDLLYRSRVGAELVERAFRPLRALAEAGVPVYVLPGNHERSRIPYGLLARHDRLHLFDRPRTYLYERDGFRLALGGFPHARDVRSRFRRLVDETGLTRTAADARLLVLHHAVEGARVGPNGFTFRSGGDVIRARDLPHGVAAVLSGHIHRAQALTRRLDGRPLVAPVLYPGSVERTSFAESRERKGYLTLGLESEGRHRGKLAGWRFHELPARPMHRLTLGAEELAHPDLETRLRRELEKLPPDSVVYVRLEAPPRGAAASLLGASSLRRLAPRTMNIELRLKASG